MQVVIFHSPGREQMLEDLLFELKGMDVYVIQSKETYGKAKFWQRFELARQYCLNSSHNDYLILPDDVSKINLSEIRILFKRFAGKPFTCNIISDYRTKCWNSKATPSRCFSTRSHRYLDLGFFDCGGATNRATLSRIQVTQPSAMYTEDPERSSGVGNQLTQKLRRLRVPMFKPIPSLCFHGDHDSVMHPELRKREPLTSK